jgi:sugar phosphate permease
MPQGFSHAGAALTCSLFNIGCACGTLLGGFLNDYAARRAPSHGRVAVAQLSVGAGVPIFLLIFFVIPDSAVGGAMLVAGLLITWCQGVVRARVPACCTCRLMRARVARPAQDCLQRHGHIAPFHV